MIVRAISLFVFCAFALLLFSIGLPFHLMAFNLLARVGTPRREVIEALLIGIATPAILTWIAARSLRVTWRGPAVDSDPLPEGGLLTWMRVQLFMHLAGFLGLAAAFTAIGLARLMATPHLHPSFRGGALTFLVGGLLPAIGCMAAIVRASRGRR